MSKSAVEEFLNRIPAGASKGRAQMVRNAAAATLLTKGHIQTAESDRGRTAFGKATETHMPFIKNVALPALEKARRQSAYGKKLLDSHEKALNKKAIGEPRHTDSIWLNRLWEMNPNKRAALVLGNPAARAAALREPELAGIEPAVFQQALRKELIEKHERPLALLEIAKATQELHDLTIREQEKAILSVPAVVEPNGAVRPFASALELSKWQEKQLPGRFVPQSATPHEEVELDAVDEAA